MFFERLGILLDYPEKTQKRQNQKGQIAIQIMDRSNEKKGQIRLIDSRDLHAQKDRSGEKKGQIMDRYRSTTSYPDPDPSNSRQERAENMCPHDQIIGLYHDIMPELPKVRVWEGRRKQFLNARWNDAFESPSTGFKSNTLEFWDAFFKYIRQSDFLMGNKSDFRANLGWIVKKENFYKIVEGNYHR